MTHRLSALCAIAACAGALADGPAAPAQETGDWRGARWGMTVEQVLAAFPGEAFRLDPEQKLADGAVVSVGIDGYVLAAQTFRVRFVFEAGGLARVSLRTPPDRYAEPGVFERVERLLTDRLGQPVASSADDSFIDLRQISWSQPRTAVDLEYIPGVVVVLYHPR
jgi:hypothetical protein